MNIIFAYLFLIFGLGLNFCFNVFSARYLGAAAYGNFNFVLTLFNIFSLIAVSGLDHAALRFIPQSANNIQYKSAIHFSTLIPSVLFFIIFLLVVLISLNGEMKSIGFIFLFSLPLFVLITVNSAILQAEHIVAPRMAFRYALEPLLKILFLFILINFSLTITAPAYALFIALIITNLALLIIYRSKLLIYSFSLVKDVWHKVISFAAPLLAVNIVNVVSGRLDIIVLGLLASSVELGHYSAAFQTASVLVIVLQGIETVYAPIFSKHIGNNDFVSLKRDYQRALRWTMLISSPLILLFIVYSDLVLLPFGDEFSESKRVFLILCIGQFVNLATGSANYILLVMSKTQIILFNSFIYALLSVAGISLGAHFFGIEGAALGVIFAFITINILRVFFVYRITGLLPFSIYYLRIVIGLISVTAISLILRPLLNYWGIMLFPSLLCCLFLMFCLHTDDKEFLMGIVKKVRLAVFK